MGLEDEKVPPLWGEWGGPGWHLVLSIQLHRHHSQA